MDKVRSFENHLSWLVADIGIGNAAWKKSGLRRTKGVDFGAEWVVELDFVEDGGGGDNGDVSAGAGGGGGGIE